MSGKPDPSSIHVALVEDDVHFQEAFKAAVLAAGDIQLAAMADTRACALQLLEGSPVDVMVVDLGLPDGSGIDVIKAAHAQWPTCELMVSTSFTDELNVIRSIEAGASGYLLKDTSPVKMMEEVRNLQRGGSPISPRIARHLLLRFRQEPQAETAQSVAAPSSGATLSAREREVLNLITKGFTYEEIAGLLSVSRNTVMTFVRRIYAKLEVKSKTEAIYEARTQGLLST